MDLSLVVEALLVHISNWHLHYCDGVIIIGVHLKVMKWHNALTFERISFHRNISPYKKDTHQKKEWRSQIFFVNPFRRRMYEGSFESLCSAINI